MTTQLTLFAGPPPAQQHSPTSIAAGRSIEPLAASQRARVLAYIQSCGERGATDSEIQRALFLDGSTERPRRVELCRSGDITRAQSMRETASGRAAQVWVAR